MRHYRIVMEAFREQQHSIIIACMEHKLIQVNKTFSKNVQGCRDGSVKNHSN